MSKKHYADRNLKFETLQLHVGQETGRPEGYRCREAAKSPPLLLCIPQIQHS